MPGGIKPQILMLKRTKKKKTSMEYSWIYSVKQFINLMVSLSELEGENVSIYGKKIQELDTKEDRGRERGTGVKKVK